MKMSANSPEQDLLPMELPSMSYAAGSHAKTFPSLGTAQDLPAEPGADFGARSFASLAKYDRASCSWRTSQICLVALLSNQANGLAEFSGTWPNSGLMRSGRTFLRRPWAHRTLGNASGSLPTPTKSDAGIGEISCPMTPDANNGKPRKVNANGQTWSAGLGRLFRIATGLPLHPNCPEWMMGFPTDWTAVPRPRQRRSPADTRADRARDPGEHSA